MTAVAEGITAPRVLPRGLQPSEHRLVLAAGDLVAALLAVVVALWLWSIPAGWQFSPRLIAERVWWFAAAPFWMIAADLSAAPISIAFSLRRTFRALARGAAFLLVAYAGWYFYAPRGILPRLVVLYFVWEALLLTLAWRVVFIAVFSQQRFRQRAIIIGSGPAASLALSIFEHHRIRQADVVGVVTDRGDPEPPGHPSSIDPDHLLDVAADRGVSEIVLAFDHPPGEALLQTLLTCQEAGAQVVRVQTLTEQLLHRVPVDLLEPDWLMTDLADATRLRESSWWAKRTLDVAGALMGLVVLAIVSPFVALTIWFDSGAPIFYRQVRVGRAGTRFAVFKFRTMTRDAERPGEARWADRDDPRTTRVGRILRKTRLDELPQVLNVLRGEMSLVGPRPERAEFVQHLQDAIPFYRARLMVPPGLTGWAQVNLPYGDSVEASRLKLEYDLYYIKHRSLLFDLTVLARTVGTVLGFGGR